MMVLTSTLLRRATSRSDIVPAPTPLPSHDIAMALMLAATRRLLVADSYVRSGDWAASKPSPMMRPQTGMPGRRIGVYGMGEIGRKIAARSAAFEGEVGYFSRSRRDVPYRYFPSLAALADRSSVLVVAVRAGRDTQHAVGADILERLGADGYVINISRGSVIDEAALVHALAEKTIAGAGLDVYAKEPHAPDTVAMQDCVMANLTAFFEGRRLTYPVN
jgi:hydroxypyruvate reductase